MSFSPLECEQETDSFQKAEVRTRGSCTGYRLSEAKAEPAACALH